VSGKEGIMEGVVHFIHSGGMESSSRGLGLTDNGKPAFWLPGNQRTCAGIMQLTGQSLLKGDHDGLRSIVPTPVCRAIQRQ